MASFTSYPPLVHHPSSISRLSTPTAHTLLTTFLHLANLDPAYRPDSTLSERGPESNSSTGNPNLTLHHLNRIKLGLGGTYLGAEEDPDAGEKMRNKATDHGAGGGVTSKRKWGDRDPIFTPVRQGIPTLISTAEEEGGGGGGGGGDGDAILTAQDTDAQEGWQDREDFELGQDDEDVDLNNAQRDLTAADGEGWGEEVLEGETGRMITVQEELDGGEGVGAGDVMHAQRTDEKDDALTGRTQPLTAQQKKERKKLKQTRSKKEKKTANVGKVKEAQNEPSKTETAKGSKEDTSRRKKKKSKVEAQP